MSELQAAPTPTKARAKAFEPAAGWPAPDQRLLNGGPRKAPPFPIDCMGELASWTAALAAAKGAPVDYVAAPLLALAAGVVGAARAVRVRDNWDEPCVLWVASVGNPSSGKSPPLAALKRAVMTLERAEGGDLEARKREWEAKRAEAEAVREQWANAVKSAVKSGSQTPIRPEAADEPEEPRAPRLMVASVTTEKLARMLAENQRGLVSVHDELSSLLGNFGRYGGEDAPFYLSAWSGDFSPVDRVKGGTITAERANLSIVGAIQPDKVQALLSGRADDGLVARFLPVWPDPPPREWSVPRVDEACAVMLFTRLRALEMDAAGGRLAPRVLRLSGEGEAIYAAWWREQCRKCDDAAGFMAEFLGKSTGACARVALVLELLEWAARGNGGAQGPAEISADAVERACTLFDDYFEPMARRVYADAALPADERCAVALLKELRRRNQRRFNAREAYREWGVPGVSDATSMAAACEALVQGGCIREIERAPASSGGRPAKDFFVNPQLLRGVAS